MSVLKRFNGTSWETIGPGVTSARFDSTDAMIAPEYDSSQTYDVGDYVVQSNNLYRCTTKISVAEAWTSGHWTQVSLGEDLSSLRNDLIVVSDTQPSGDNQIWVDPDDNDVVIVTEEDLNNIVANEYSTSGTYAVGDYVMHGCKLYRCKTAITTAEVWTAAHWTEVKIGNEVSDLKNTLVNVTESYLYGKNLFNEITGFVIDGKALNESDEFVDNANFHITDYIPIDSVLNDANKITVSWGETDLPNTVRINAYYVGKIFDHSLGNIAASNGKLTVSIDSSTKYIRISIRKDINNLQVEYGGSKTSYEAGYTANDKNTKEVIDKIDDRLNKVVLDITGLEWEQGGIDGDGQDIDSGIDYSHRVRTDFLEIGTGSILKYNVTGTNYNVSFFFYDNNHNYITRQSGLTGEGSLISSAPVVRVVARNDGVDVYPDSFKSNFDIISIIKVFTDKKGLDGKTLWTLWDSLGHNTWQDYFVEDTGCYFYKNLNTKTDKPISWGGSNSDPATDDGTQARAMNLVSYKGTYPVDLIIIENVNDYDLTGNIGQSSDAPFMRSQKTVIDTGATSYSDAVAYVNSNLASILANTTSASRKKGSILSFNYASGSEIRGSKITFTNAATSNGNISITWGGSTFSVAVTTGMTTADIAAEFAKYSFGAGVIDIASGNVLTITYYTTTSNRATFSGGTTGVTATVEDSTGVTTYNLYFMSDDPSDWTDTTKWVNSVSLYSIYKGLLAYLQKELPQAKIYWATPWAVSVNFSSNTYKDASGDYDIDKFTFPRTALFNAQKEVANMYNIQTLELDKKSGMSIINVETYFNSNNIHPKAIGYKLYADTMANMIGKLP